MHKIFITGAAGFIGSSMADLLLSQGKEVVGWDNFSTGQSEFLAGAEKNPAFKLVVGEGTAANESNPVTPDDVARWSSNPLLVVQVPPEKAVFWSKPDDWEHTPDSTPSTLGFPQDDRFLALHYNGTVTWLSKQMPIDQFHQLMLMPKSP